MNFRTSLRLVAALALCAAPALIGCGQTCGPSNCVNGCCDANNFCQVPSADHCGGGGAACQACGAGLACMVNGACGFELGSGGNGSGGTTTGAGSSTTSTSSGSSGSSGNSSTTSTSSPPTTGGSGSSTTTTSGSTGTASTSTTGTGGSSGSTGAPSLVLWHLDPLQSQESFNALVAGQNLVVASRLGSPRILALDDDGNTLYDVDLNALLPSDFSSSSTADLAIADDGTVVAVVSGGTTSDELVHLSSTGQVLWHTQVSIYDFGGVEPATLSHPAIATDGTIYVSASYGQGSNFPLPQLAAFGEDGTAKFQIDVATDAERGSSAVAPVPDAPWIAPDGTVKFLLQTSTGAVVRTVDPAQQAVTTTVALGSLDVMDVEPLADGTWLANGFDAARSVSTCDGTGFQSVLAQFDGTGSQLWSTDLNGEQVVNPAVQGQGGQLLVAWGNCSDGTGAGAYVLSGAGQLGATYSNSLGDGIQVLGTSTGDVYLLVQNDYVAGVETGPVIDIVNAATGALDGQVDVGCSPAGYANDVSAQMVALSNGKLAVICDENGNKPGAGGIYGLDVPTSAPSGATWTYWNGTAQATRRASN